MQKKIVYKTGSVEGITLTETVGTDTNIVEVRFDRLANYRDVLLTVQTTNGAIALGAARTITVNKYWSDYQVTTLADVPTVLAGRKEATTALALVTTAARVNQYEVSGGIIRPKATYLYISLDRTVFDAGATLLFKLNIVSVPPQDT